MKIRTKYVVALCVAGVVMLSAVTMLVIALASFNASAGSGLTISYTAQNVNASVISGYVITTNDSTTPSSLSYTTVTAGDDNQIVFSSEDTADSVTKTFDDIAEVSLEKDEYIYLKYAFTHTGDANNSLNYLNISLNQSFTSQNNVKVEYALYSPDKSSVIWMGGLNGVTATRDGDNIVEVYARISVDVKTQDANLDGAFIWNLSGSETEYYANLVTGAMFNEAIKGATVTTSDTAIRSVKFGKASENATAISSAESSYSVVSDGSGPITAYKVLDSSTSKYDVFVLSDAEIYATDCSELFKYLTALSSVDYSNLNTKYVSVFNRMFQSCTTLTSIDTTKFSTENATDMGYMFYGCSALNSLTMTGLNTARVTNLEGMFNGCTGLTAIDLSNFDTEKVTNMNSMFYGCSGLTSLSLSTFNTTNVTDMSYMFLNCSGLTTLDVTPLDTQNVTTMENMFYGCSKVTALDLSGFNTFYVTKMNDMFRGCSALSTLNMAGVVSSNVIDMNDMFVACSALEILDLSSFNTAKVKSFGFMFSGCTKLKTIYAHNWDTTSATTSANMFSRCTSLVGGNGTTFNSSIIDATYARVDVAGTPGYFTEK